MAAEVAATLPVLGGALGAVIVGSVFAAADVALASLTEGRLQVLAQGDGPRDGRPGGRKDARSAAFARYVGTRERVDSCWLVARIFAISLAAVLVERGIVGGLDLPARSLVGPLVAVLGCVATYGTFAGAMGAWARRHPETVGYLVLAFFRPVEWVLLPFAQPLTLVASLTGRLFAPKGATEARITHTELRWVVAESKRAGAIAHEPAEIIQNVLESTTVTARELMVPRNRVVALELGARLRDAVATATDANFAAYPVYRDTIDNVVGFVEAKDLFAADRSEGGAALSALELPMEPVTFVAESQTAASVLREMRARRATMAVVADAFGGIAGVVTFRDVVEGMMGQTPDSEGSIERMDDGRIVADAAVSLAELSAELGYAFPVNGAFESLGGLLVHRAGRVPVVGAKVHIEGLTLIVREADEKRVTRVEIVPAPETSTIREAV